MDKILKVRQHRTRTKENLSTSIISVPAGFPVQADPQSATVNTVVETQTPVNSPASKPNVATMIKVGPYGEIRKKLRRKVKKGSKVLPELKHLNRKVPHIAPASNSPFNAQPVIDADSAEERAKNRTEEEKRCEFGLFSISFKQCC